MSLNFSVGSGSVVRQWFQNMQPMQRWAENRLVGLCHLQKINFFGGGEQLHKRPAPRAQQPGQARLGRLPGTAQTGLVCVVAELLSASDKFIYLFLKFQIVEILKVCKFRYVFVHPHMYFN